MKLPNFLHSGQLNSLRQQMGAELVALKQPVSPMKAIDLPIIERLYKEGIEVDFDEVTVLDDGTLAYKGHRVILYIRDLSSHGEKSALPKYHNTYCRTLTMMQQNNRFSKYVLWHRDDGRFTINWIGSKDKSITAKLDVCQNCLDGLAWKGFNIQMPHTERLERVADFNLKEFFTKYPRDLIAVRPQYNADNAPLNDYPENWQIVSAQAKAASGYRCQRCSINLSGWDAKYLHVHHLNGMKNDCRDSNLEVLCIRCHSDEPMHSHMRNLPDYKEFQRRYG